MNRKPQFPCRCCRGQSELSSRIPYMSREKAGSPGRARLSFLGATPGCGDMGVRKAREEPGLGAEGSPSSHTQGGRALTSFPEMHSGVVVEEQRLSISDLPSHLYTSVQLWDSLGGPVISIWRSHLAEHRGSAQSKPSGPTHPARAAALLVYRRGPGDRKA